VFGESFDAPAASAAPCSLESALPRSSSSIETARQRADAEERGERTTARRKVHAALGEASRRDALMDSYYDGGATVRTPHEADYEAIDGSNEGDAQGAVASTTGKRRRRRGRVVALSPSATSLLYSPLPASESMGLLPRAVELLPHGSLRAHLPPPPLHPPLPAPPSMKEGGEVEVSLDELEVVEEL
jgi:hypothetical protein